MEEKMSEDNETMTRALQQDLSNAGHQISHSTSWRCRRELGWTNRRTAYCYLACHAKKEKRLQWAHANMHEAANGFEDVIFTDETCVT